MDSVIILALPGNEDLAAKLAAQLGCETGRVNVRKFPDGETLVNIDAMVGGKEVFIVASLDHPDEKFFALYFLAKTLKEFGAYSIKLVAPYLAYMRQDKRFQPGECVSSYLFAHLLSSFVDELITIDPHLHRHFSLSEMYYIPTKLLHTSSLIAEWIRNHIPDAILIGPDEESEKWVAAVAEKAESPYIILKKTDEGYNNTGRSIPDVSQWKNRTPVLIDDIVSTAFTMINTINDLKAVGYNDFICVGVHGIFSGDAFKRLSETGAVIVTCNTIPHITNGIDISSLISTSIQKSIYQCVA